MTLESDVAAISSRSLWLRARDLSTADGAAIESWSDYDGALVNRGRTNASTDPAQASTSTHPALSPRSVFYPNANGLAVGRVVMTGVVSTFASGFYTRSEPTLAFDGVGGSGVRTNGWAAAGTSGVYVGVQFSAGFVSTGYKVWGAAGAPTRTPKDWQFQGSNDGSSWTTLDTQTGQNPSSSTGQAYTFSNSTAYAYYRLLVSAVQSGTDVGVDRLDITGAPTKTVFGGSGGGEIWIVMKAANDAGQHAGPYRSGTASEGYYKYSDGKVYWQMGGTTRLSVTPAATVTNWHIARFVRTAAGTQQWYVDGVLQQSGSGGTTSWTDYVLLGTSALSAAAPGAWHAEVICFNAELSSGDATKVSDYLTATHFTAPGTTAVADGSLPALDALAAVTVTTTASADGALPPLDGYGTADVPTSVTAEVVGDLPALDGTATVDVPAAVTLTADGTLPTLEAAADVTVTSTGVEAAADGTLPTLDGWAAAEVDVEDLVTCYDEVTTGDLAFVGLTAAPDPADIAPIMREAYQMPELDAAHPAYQAYVDYPVEREVVGWLHLWIGHRDVTYFRGVPTVLREWYREAPFGDKTCAWEMPQLAAWDKPGEGDLDFLQPDAPVEIGIVDTEGNIRREWAGFLDSRTKGQGATRRSDFEAKGAFWAALHKIHEPVPYQEPVDIGILIPRLLNAIPGKRWNDIPEKITGLKTRERGARGEYVWTVVQRIFAVDGWTADGRQWTLARVGDDDFALRLKSAMTTVDATVAYGTPLVHVELTIDQSSRVDVAFARGIAENGGGWANVKYPATEIFNGLPYPNADAGDFLNLGTTDADTTSGTGVSDFQEKARELGFTRMQPSGVMSSKWVEVVRDVQRALDITVDGSLGPQTWEAIFTTVNEDIDLTPRRLPMAYKPQAWPTIDGANGQILGPNPAYDETIVVREVDVDLGPNVSKSRGRKLMKTYLAVHGEPSATGEIECIGDFNDLDRTLADIGHNVAIPGFDGDTPVVQLASKRVQMDGDSDGRQYVATFTVDERARDALTIDQILERDRAALPDPARRPGNPNRQSRNVRDQAFEWDDESPCGVLPKTAVNGSTGLWTRKVVPFSTVGQLSGVDLHCTVPFGFALFASLRMTPNKLRTLVGNPFASPDPWRPHMEELVEEYGLLGCWGSQGDACGYGYGMESDGYSFNGRFREGSTLQYVTETPPYASVLLFARGDSGFVWGEFLAARQS